MERKLIIEFISEDDLILYLTGEIDEHRKVQIEKLILENEQNRRVYFEYKAIWEINKTIRQSDSIDLEAARKKTFQKIRIYGIRKVFTIYQRVAAILLLPLIGAFILYSLHVSSLLSCMRISSDIKSQNEVNVLHGMRLNVILTDGTKVWLNSGSYFKYPNMFTGKSREVYLEGEGYFEIVENRKIPFVIKTAGPEIVATGTKLNVLAYPDDNHIETSLLTGKVHMNLQSEKGKVLLTVLKSDEKITYDKENQSFSRKQIHADDLISWTKGYLVFNNDSFEEVVKKLNRWYNTDIIILDDSLKTYKYTATFIDETIFQVMELLKLSAPIDYKIYSRKKMPGNTFSKQEIRIWLKKNAKSSFY